MRAIVAGAGIAGLVVARQLGLAGWEVDVVEKSTGPRPEGYMMDFFGPGVDASTRIGLYPRLADVSYHVKSADYVDTDGRVMARLDYERFSRAAGGRVLSLLRPDMEHAAIEALDDVPAGRVRIHYDAPVTGAWTDDDGAAVETGGSSLARFDGDVLIGADGIHSQVRALLFGPESDFLRPLGMRAAAYICDAPDLHDRFGDRFVLTDSIDRMAGMYGIRSSQVAAFLVYRDEATGGEPLTGTKDRLKQKFSGLGDATDRLLALCPEHPYDDVVAQIVMPTWRSYRALVIGDAASAVSLLAGQGGSLATAGGALLGDTLGPVASLAGITGALAEFEHAWRPVAEAAQATGRRAAATFLPTNRRQRLVRRWIMRAAGLPPIDRIVARQIVKRIAT